MLDFKFIKFYIKSVHNKTMEEYFHVGKSAVSNWRTRGLPENRIMIFIDIEGTDDIYELFEKIYPKSS